MSRLCKVALFTCLLCFFASPGAFCADETITITTYYPSPSGSYNELRTSKMTVSSTRAMPTDDGTLRWGTGMAELTRDQGGSIELGGLNPGTGNPGTPYIDFHNDNTAFPAGDYDYRMVLMGDNEFEMVGGTTTYKNNDGSPALIRVGEVYFCTSY